ncbi:MAG: hypothetical protein HS115_03745 [Spirochaetales bacterium]|nr:hypothetical protein [Spirochaetales bacterium]
MIDTEERTEPDDEEDLLSLKATPGAPGLTLPEQPDLIDEGDLRNAMAQFNPLAMRDIATIEKGVEHFFLFNGSHRALIRVDQLQFLRSADARFLAERRVAAEFEYLDYNVQTRRLTRTPVLIRPASLKADQVAKVIRGCIHGSLCAVLEWIADRDDDLYAMEEKGELARHIGSQLHPDGNEESGLVAQLSRLSFLSFESILDGTGARTELCAPLLSGLRGPVADLITELSDRSAFSPKCRLALDRRAGQPPLLSILPDWSLVRPAALSLVEMKEGNLREIRSELEWIHLLFVQLARKILLEALPADEAGWIERRGISQDERYLKTIRSHPSIEARFAAASSNFPFADAFEGIIREQRKLGKIRVNGLVEILLQEALSRMNMRFEPVLFSKDNFTVNKSITRMYSNEDDLYEAVIERLMAHPEVLKTPERRSDLSAGLYILYRANLPRAFISARNRRSFLHVMARESGHPGGIYDFARIATDNPTLQKEQLELSRAIKEWENTLEAEKRKKEKKARGGFFQRILDFFLALFGQEKRKERRAEDFSEVGALTGRRGVIVGPRQKVRKIPPRVEETIQAVEETHKGFIWLDEVLKHLPDPKLSSDALGDLLFYDQEGRYTEIRALQNQRRVFIARENESSREWLTSTLDYLENLSRPGPEIPDLRSALQKRLESL